MFRVVSLFALLAVAFAGPGPKAQRKSRARNRLPSPKHYLIEDQKLVNPGGVFSLKGVSEGDEFKDYCAYDPTFYGMNSIDLDPFTLSGVFDVHVMVKDNEGVASVVNTRGKVENLNTFDDNPTFTFTVPETGLTYRAEKIAPNTLTVSVINSGCESVDYAYVDTNTDTGSFEFTSSRTHLSLSDNFVIKQTRTGGLKIQGTLYATQLDNMGDPYAIQTSTVDFTSTGSVCDKLTMRVYDSSTSVPFTTVPSGKSGVGKPNKKNGQNPNRNRVCESYRNVFKQYAVDTTTMSFNGYFKFYNHQGRAQKFQFSIVISRVDGPQDLWRVGLVDDAVFSTPVDLYLYERSENTNSDLEKRYLSHSEIIEGGNGFKQAQKSAGYQVGLANQGRVKDNRIIASSFEDDYRKEKPRSFKKGTKNKKTGRKNRRRRRKAAGQRVQLGN